MGRKKKGKQNRKKGPKQAERVQGKKKKGK